MKRLKTLYLIGSAATLIAGALVGCDRAASAEEHIAWVKDFDAALQRAKSENKPVLVDFFATWCGPCQMMERQTYPNQAVADALTNWVSVKIDVDKNPALAKRFNVEGIPTLAILQPDGREVTRTSGYLGPQDFVAFTREAQQTFARSKAPK